MGHSNCDRCGHDKSMCDCPREERKMPELTRTALSPSELERLAMLAEEACEIGQIAMKIVRHGPRSHHPDNPDETNMELLQRELADLLAVVEMMVYEGDIHRPLSHEVTEATARKRRWMHHHKREREPWTTD